MMNRLRLTALTGFLVLAFTGVSAQAGRPQLKFPLITSPCQQDEIWSFTPLVPAIHQGYLTNVPETHTEAIELLNAAIAFRSTPQSTELADYLMARAFYSLKLVHLAHTVFQSIVKPVAGPSIAMEATIASLACLQQIHKDHPSMTFKRGLTPTLNQLLKQRLSPIQKKTIWQALSTIAGRKLSNRSSYLTVQEELAGLQGSGPYEALIQSLDAFKRQSEIEAISYSEKFLKFKNLPEDLIPQANSIHLNLGRVSYNRSAFTTAISEFKKVERESLLFPSSIMDSSWAYFLAKKYEDAANQAVNLVLKELKNVFAPHAPVLLAIIQYENCRYNDSFESLKAFKKIYGPVYKKLYDWYQQHRARPINYYGILADFLHNKKGLPKNIAAEWVKSPVFIGLQQEMNALLEEKTILASLKADLNARKNGFETFPAPVLQYVKQTFQIVDDALPKLERSIVAQINNELLWRNYSMIMPLLEASDNVQLLEAEVLKELGNRVLDKNREASGKGKAAPLRKKSSNDLPALDWGTVDKKIEEDESWADEVGSIRTDLTNLCPKK